MTLTGRKQDGAGTVVPVNAESATAAYDGESDLVAVQGTAGGYIGGKVTGQRARGMLATGMIHRLHSCRG